MADNRRDPTDMDRNGPREPIEDKRAMRFRASLPPKSGVVSVHGSGTHGRITLEVERDAFPALAILSDDYTDGTLFDVVIAPLGLLDEDDGLSVLDQARDVLDAIEAAP